MELMELNIPHIIVEDYKKDILSPLDFSKGIDVKLTLRPAYSLLSCYKALRKKLLYKKINKDIKLYFIKDGVKIYWGIDTYQCWKEDELSKMYQIDRLIFIHISFSYPALYELIVDESLYFEKLSELGYEEINRFKEIIDSTFIPLNVKDPNASLVDSSNCLKVVMPTKCLPIAHFGQYLHPLSLNSIYCYRLAKFLIDTVNFHGFRRLAEDLKVLTAEYEESTRKGVETVKEKLSELIDKSRLSNLIDLVFENFVVFDQRTKKAHLTVDAYKFIEKYIKENRLDLNTSHIIDKILKYIDLGIFIFDENEKKWVRK